MKKICFFLLITSYLYIGMGNLTRQVQLDNDAVYYLSLGDSIAYGYDPYDKDRNISYADYLHNQLIELYPKLKLVKLGCDGISSGGMIAGKFRCDYTRYENAKSQLEAATNILRSQPGRVKFVTITIGTNDMHHRGSRQQLLNNLQKNLDVILPQLQEAGGPSIKFIGTSYYCDGLTDLNQALQEKYQSYNVLWADIATPFYGSSKRTYSEHMCEYTYLCTRFNDTHPNYQGSKFFADIIHQTLDD